MSPNEAWELVGGLSSPSKMPCHGYSIPAVHCITGSKLAKVPGSVCAGCYALKGRYLFGNVKSALQRRFESLKNPLWVDAMVCAIKANESSGFFRWHDSGDLQGVWHLRNICNVCAALPQIRFWLPTREVSILREYVESGFAIPSNLTVRISAYMVDEPAAESFAKRHGFVVSEVTTGTASCPSPNQGNKCLDCRKCWRKDFFSVSYAKH